VGVQATRSDQVNLDVLRLALADAIDRRENTWATRQGLLIAVDSAFAELSRLRDEAIAFAEFS
jgi:hypothetical protein